MTDNEKLAYAAGLIDADGSIMIVRGQDKRVVRGVGFRPVISLKSVDVEILEFLQATLGGTISRKHQLSRRNNLRANFTSMGWSCSARSALAAARRLAPYLLVKRRQANAVVAFYEEAAWTLKGSIGRGMPEAEHARRASLSEQVRAFNRREPVRILDSSMADNAPWQSWAPGERTAYGAGLIDADGHIAIRRYRNAPSARGIAFSPRIAVRCADKEMLEFLKLEFGGSVGAPVNSNPVLNVNVTSYAWAAPSRAAYNAAKKIEPYLVAKKKQARIILALYEQSEWKRTGRAMSEEEFQRRKRLHAEMLSANRREHLPRLPLTEDQPCNLAASSGLKHSQP